VNAEPTDSASNTPRRARLAISAWCVAAVLLWCARGWQLSFAHGILPESLDPEAPLDQLRAIGSFVLLNGAALGWGLMFNGRGRFAPRLDAFGVATLLLVGHVVTALIVLGVGVAGLLPWGITAVFGGAAGLAGRWSELREAVLGPLRFDPESRKSDRRLRALWLAVLAAALGGTFVVALAPAIESDGMRYHLFGPQEYLKAGAVVGLPWHAFTNLPFQTNMLFMASMWTGGMRAPQLMHWTYLPLIMATCAALARELGCGRTTARCAGALAGCSPAMLAIAGWPFVDLSTCAFTLASIVWAARAARSADDRARGALLAGAFAGAAVGTKLTAIVPGIFTGLAAIVVAMRSRALGATLARFAIPAILISLPWFAKNWVLHRNPVYPAAYSIFGGWEWSAENDAFYKTKAREKGFGRSPIDLALAPLDVTMRWAGNRSVEPPKNLIERIATRYSTGFEDHNPGPALLALLPLALAWPVVRMARGRAGVADWLVLLHLAGGWLAWFFTYQSVRFLLVPIALACVAGTGAAMAAMSRAGRESRSALMGALLLAACGVAWFASWAFFAKPSYPVPAALGLISRDRVLSEALSQYDALAYLNAEMKPEERALYVGEFRGAYATGNVLLSDWFDTPRVLTEIRAYPDNAAMVAGWRERGIRYVLYNHAELSLYAAAYFKPRFDEGEWRRFEELDRALRAPETIAFEGREGVFVVDVERME